MYRKMIDEVGTPAMLEQLAEESVELAKAALKKARILRGENPVAKDYTMKVADANLIEEFSDVYQCADELGIPVDFDQLRKKNLRWQQRLNDKKKMEEEKWIHQECQMPKEKPIGEEGKMQELLQKRKELKQIKIVCRKLKGVQGKFLMMKILVLMVLLKLQEGKSRK